MQGPEPEKDNKGRLKKVSNIGELLLSVKRGDKEFLNRPAIDWCVRLDQLPLLLFSRSTFYEKSAGRGYLTGTTGDLEIRTFIIDPTSLRKTIWLNVLARNQQKNHFQLADSGNGYDDWMWNRLPKTAEVPANDISLRSGLFWTVANIWIDIQELEEPHRCMITGDMLVPGDQAGTRTVVNSTNIAFGTTIVKEDGKGARQSFFRHPNAPYKYIEPKKKPPFTTHLEVHEKAGLIGEMGGLFYAKGRDEITLRGNKVKLFNAPVLDQLPPLNETLIDEYDSAPKYNLLCFGFHMLSSKKNVHGGYESELFSYPILEAESESQEIVERLMNGFATITSEVDEILCSGVQMCVMEDVELKENESGAIKVSQTSHVTDTGPIRDASKELWREASMTLHNMIGTIGDIQTTQEIEKSEQKLRNKWTDVIARKAELIFYRYFNDAAYSRSPDLMIVAHNAKGLFNWKLLQMDAEIFERRKLRNTPSTETTENNNG